MKFEEMLEQLEPMISAHIRKLHIYKNHEHFRQVARMAIWQAWQKYDSTRGDFQPYASQTIRGALLDELQRTKRYEERYVPMESESLKELRDQGLVKMEGSILEILQAYTTNLEFDLLRYYYYGGYTHEEIAKVFKITTAALQKSKSRLLARLRTELKREDLQ